MQIKSMNGETRRGALAALLAAPGLGACASSPPAEPPARFERYGHIERSALTSRATGDAYSIEIYRPPSYATSERAYPALFLLDGEYSFDAAVALSSYMQRGEIAEHVIIGISYDVPFGPPLAEKRTRNFTPPTTNGVLNRDAPAPYYLFLRDELLPEIARRLRIDPEQKTVWGYSLSGSFVTWLNYYDASLFRNSILASPNWGQFGVQQRLIEGVVFNAPGPVARKLFFSFDVEAELQGIPEPERAIRAFVDAGLPGYQAAYALTHGETHATSWFATLPAALRFIYGVD